MYLNVNVSAANDPAISVPRTPEILNLLAAGPFDASAQALVNPGARNAQTPEGNAVSPARDNPPGNPGIVGVQNARSFLVKEGLKLTIQNKRLATGKNPIFRINDQILEIKHEQLTAEDEERRRRRRERNKLAATKCRNRKKEKTGLLMIESDILEDQNVTMRKEILNLEEERRRLVSVLAAHSTNCAKPGAKTNSIYSESTASYFSSDCQTRVDCSEEKLQRCAQQVQNLDCVNNFHSGFSQQRTHYSDRGNESMFNASLAQSGSGQDYFGILHESSVSSNDMSPSLNYSSDSYDVPPGNFAYSRTNIQLPSYQ